MTPFERIAIFTLVENMENQLRGLKTLIAASANADVKTPAHKTTSTLDAHDSYELSDEEEAELEAQLETARKIEIEKMRTKAEGAFQGLWDDEMEVQKAHNRNTNLSDLDT